MLKVPVPMESLIFVSVFLLSLVPFEGLARLHLGFITLNTFEFFYFIVIALLLTKIVMSGKLKYPSILIGFIALAITYLLISSVLYGSDLKQTFTHYRFYLPFFVATLFLAAGIKISAERWLLCFTWAALLGSLVALISHFFFPSTFLSLADASRMAVTAGRLYWTNSSLFFFVLLAFFMRRRPNLILLITALLFSSVAVFNGMGRTQLLGAVLFLVCTVILSGRVVIAIKRTGYMFVILTSMFLAALILIRYDERLLALAQLRFVNRDHLINHSFMERFTLYEQYRSSLATYFPIGQGLGRPFSTNIFGDVYTTDISLLSFLIPFGIAGGILFLSFLIKLTTLIRRSSGISPSEKRVILSLFFVLVVMSFNYDLFARNNMVIYFTLFVMGLNAKTQEINMGDRLQ